MDSKEHKKETIQNSITKSEFKKYVDFIHDDSIPLPEHERTYLKNLLKNGEIEEFKDQYRRHLQNLDRVGFSDEDIELQLNVLKKDNNEFRNLLRFYTARLSDLQESNTSLSLKNKELENLNIEKESLLEQTFSRIKELEASNNELTSRAHQERIDQKIPEYVNSVKDDLGDDDDHFISLAKTWAIAGAIAGLSAVIFSFISLYFGTDFINAKGFELFYLFTRGLIGISILSWLSYICLSISKKYTHESIRRKDRRHALMFGQVFLQIYGSTATKEDAIQVFKDWNMSGDSAFSDQMDYPPSFQTLWSTAKEKIKPSHSEKSSD